MTIAIKSDAAGYGALEVNGVDAIRFGSDTSGHLAPFRNKLINGGFDIWQRGASQTITGYGSDDRWSNDNLGTTKTHSQVTMTLAESEMMGGAYYSSTVVTSVAGSGNYCSKYQPIEGVRTLAGKTATISFWAKTDSAKNIAVEFGQHFGSGGTPTPDIYGVDVTAFSLTTAWTKYTATVAIPSISSAVLGTNGDDSMFLQFWFDCGSNFNTRTNSLGQQSGTFDIANVQLEEGSIATEFEKRPSGVELLLCQRYYATVSLSGQTGVTYSSNGDTRSNLYFPTFMRVPPSMSVSGSTTVIACGYAADVTNVSLGTLTVAPVSNSLGAIIGISNYSAFSTLGDVFAWGTSNQTIVYLNAELY
jgi:hypothetical protein